MAPKIMLKFFTRLIISSIEKRKRKNDIVIIGPAQFILSLFYSIIWKAIPTPKSTRKKSDKWNKAVEGDRQYY